MESRPPSRPPDADDDGPTINVREASEAPAPLARAPFMAFKARQRTAPTAPRRPAPVGSGDGPTIELGSAPAPAAHASPSDGPHIETRQSELPPELLLESVLPPARPFRASTLPPLALQLSESPPAAASGEELIAEAPGLQDLPEDDQQSLWQTAATATLGEDETLPAFALALVLQGEVTARPHLVDQPCLRLRRGEVLFPKSTLGARPPVRFAASRAGTEVALWNANVLEPVLAASPWVEDDLCSVGDLLLARAGALLGVIGERLEGDQALDLLDRCTLVSLPPWEPLPTTTDEARKVVIVGAGSIELLRAAQGTSSVEQELISGDVLAPRTHSETGPAPEIRGGARGALVLTIAPSVLAELAVRTPALAELIAR